MVDFSLRHCNHSKIGSWHIVNNPCLLAAHRSKAIDGGERGVNREAFHSWWRRRSNGRHGEGDLLLVVRWRRRWMIEKLLVLSSLLSKPQNLWLIWKLVILLSITFLITTLVRIQFYYDTSPQFSSSSSSQVYRRSHLSIWKDDEGFEGNPRIVFLFLVRRDLRLDFIWKSFFECEIEGVASVIMNPNGKGKAPVVNDVVGHRLIFGSLSGFVCDGNDVNSSQYATHQTKQVVEGGERFRSPSVNDAVGRRLLFGSVSGYVGGKYSEIGGRSIYVMGMILPHLHMYLIEIKKLSMLVKGLNHFLGCLHLE
ncbi:hypothetical protein L6452_34370 [Arctium lappa]|uniref:Uncharacterized protein n=1 Tax=Arctium lappa TaxID=4217 RepID=A0ACB8YJ68_ARCLA|nr:hypothetical protein L6452_34370 [Arctium lappa]